MSVIVLGSSNTDLVIRGPRLPRPGETVLGGEFYQAAGGKGANQAVAAARASLRPVTFLAAVGDDAFGRAAREQLARENLRLDFLKVVSGVASGVALILVDARGENCISVASGANLCLAPEDIDAVPDAIFQSARVLLACLESPLPTVLRGLERAKRLGLTTILNPAPADPEILAVDMLRHVDVLTPNEHEAAMLAGAEDEEAAARRLQTLGCRSVVVTLGAAGCLVAEEDVTRIPAAPAAAVDTTAAGDAFSGALAVALAEGKPLVEAARWAGRAAAISVTRAGAQPSLPTRAEIEAAIG